MNHKLQEAIETVLKEAKTKIEALGARCIIAPMLLPQGMTISLHIGETVTEVAAAYTASEVGGEQAHTKEGGEQFSKRLAFAIETLFDPAA